MRPPAGQGPPDPDPGGPGASVNYDDRMPPQGHLAGYFMRTFEAFVYGQEKLVTAMKGLKKQGQERNYQGRVNMRDPTKKITAADEATYLGEADG